MLVHKIAQATNNEFDEHGIEPLLSIMNHKYMEILKELEIMAQKNETAVVHWFIQTYFLTKSLLNY